MVSRAFADGVLSTQAGLIGEASMHAGDRVTCKGEECGRVTSSAWSPRSGFIGAAMLRNEAAKPGEMIDVITPTATVRAEVRQMPLLRSL